jgi:A/G-specific adenine glycosylase
MKRPITGPGPDANPLVGPLLHWFAREARDLPWRHTTDPYALWVAETMLQQTQVATVIPYWERWMKAFPDVATLAAAAIDDVLKLWEGLGYYSRARYLQAAARQIVADANGRFPRTAAELLVLPGIGPYTAGAIASTAFNEPAPILDGNVIRVLTRIHALAGDPRSKHLNQQLWKLAADLVAAADLIPVRQVPRPHGPLRLAGACSQLNQALMELGATLCNPRHPRCSECPVATSCKALHSGETARFPELPARPVITPRRLATVLWFHHGQWLVRRRPDDAINGGFWEFPNLECAPDQDPVLALTAWLRIPADALIAAGTLRHSITRYRFTQHLFRTVATPGPSLPAGELLWASPDALAALALTAAHRRLVPTLTQPPVLRSARNRC